MKEHQVKIPKKLIEVALPLDAINIASAREKSIRHGHPSTLHLWWARRPLAAARAVLFAQLVNDPGYERNLNRGLNKKEAAKERKRLFQIIERLVQWENTNNEEILKEAREEIWKSWRETCALNKDHLKAAELFNPDKLPAFHDPFAGGGAIPLEAQRLGLESYASDLNPVAVLINKAMIEIPPKFADMPPVNPESRSEQKLIDQEWSGSQGLAEDVRYYGKWMRDEAEKRIGHLYPKVEVTEEMVQERPDLKQYLGKKLTVIAWIWARTVKSPNPAYSDCDVPLVSTFVLSTKSGKEAYIEPVIKGDDYSFFVRTGKSANMKAASNGTKLSRGANFRCLLSNTPMALEYVRGEFRAKRDSQRLMAIVAEGDSGRIYLSPSPEQDQVASSARPTWKPDQAMSQDSSNLVSGRGYGITKWSELFADRQLVALNTLSELITEAKTLIERDVASSLKDAKKDTFSTYSDAVVLYLAFSIDKAADYWSKACTWHQSKELIRNTFGRQAIPMAWDYAETNIFSTSTGNISSGIEWAVKAIRHFPIARKGYAHQKDAQTQNLSSGCIVSTGPPYYDNIEYSVLSDFFYMWLRRSLKSVYPDLFATLSVPKEEELVATAYRHASKKQAEIFFLNGMTQAMSRIATQSHPGYPVTIYYAFKQSESDSVNGTTNTGWDTFLEAVIRAGFSITGTWPMRTELGNRMIGSGANALASSIILVCHKRDPDETNITRREFLKELKEELSSALDVMIGGDENSSPVAPVDLAQAIIGPGMAVYSKYSAVLEADGSRMSVHDALILINRSLADSGSEFDAETQFCLDWFSQQFWTSGSFGTADVLARAKGTSVDRVRDAGVAEAAGGKVKLLKPAEYSGQWDPQRDNNIPSWELLHRISSKLEGEGTESAAKLLARVESHKSSPAAIRKLAYRLYTLCERSGKAEDARRYNNLIVAWDTIHQKAESLGRAGSQAKLFQDL